MILTCPECAVRYLVDARGFGATGRTVRCARCGHTWHQAPIAEEASPAATLVLGPELEPAGEPLPPPIIPPRLRVRRDYKEDEKLFAAPTAASRSRRMIVGITLAAAVVVLVFGAVALRSEVMSAWPGSARLYGLAGFSVAAPDAGLELRNVTPTRAVENGLPTLVIVGEVANTSTEARPVPKLKVILRDASDHDLQSWTFSATEDNLAPGAALSFRTSVAQPADAAAGVVVTFADDKDKG